MERVGFAWERRDCEPLAPKYSGGGQEPLTYKKLARFAKHNLPFQQAVSLVLFRIAERPERPAMIADGSGHARNLTKGSRRCTQD